MQERSDQRLKHVEARSLFMGFSLHPVPWLSITAIVLPALFLVLTQFFPQIGWALQRDAESLGQGEWWRLLTPLVVVSDGWLALLWVSLGFVCVGFPLEQYVGRRAWLLLFLCGALVGELAGYVWQPYGGGTSVALFGVLGGLHIFMFQRKAPVLPLGAIYGISVSLLLLCEALSMQFTGQILPGTIVAFVLTGIGINLLLRLFRRGNPPRLISGIVLGVLTICTVLLTMMHDNHGPALGVGLVVGTLLVLLDTPSKKVFADNGKEK